MDSSNDWNKYETEAKNRWGTTKEYKEYEEKTETENHASKGMMKIFSNIGKLKDRFPWDSEVQEEIRCLQEYITDNYYTCTDDILRQLGQMYVKDERFKKNIDGVGGQGTSEFVKEAIIAYCGNIDA